MKTFDAKVYITLKKTVLDPQGSTLKRSLSTMGYDSIGDVRVGKYLEVCLQQESEEKAQNVIAEMCQKLLANPVIEEYRFEIKESKDPSHV